MMKKNCNILGLGLKFKEMCSMSSSYPRLSGIYEQEIAIALRNHVIDI